MLWRTASLCTNPAVKRTGGSLWLLRSLALAAALSILTWGGVSLAVDPCPDGDGDGYASTCTDCTNSNCPTLDCNDGDGSINPGETEKCGLNNVDEDCDGSINEGFIFGRESGTTTGGMTYDCNDGIDNDGDTLADSMDPQCAAAACILADPGGCYATTFPPFDPLPGVGVSCCLTASFRECTGNGAADNVCPVPQQGQLLAVPETGARCSDFDDNDCNQLTDVAEVACQSPETCNGKDDDGSGRESGGSAFYDCSDGVDNDGDTFIDGADSGCSSEIDEGFGLGGPCNSSGLGECVRTGQVICDGSGGTKCSASPAGPKNEGGCADVTCRDGLDNDCDGDTDTADDDCPSVAETCDGLDNDCDGDIDEGLVLGAACTSGVGACEAPGVEVCNGAAGVVCNAVPNLAGSEGPTGVTCTDNIDNDCDGTTDVDGPGPADPGCGSANLSVTCSLPLIRALPGSDCNQWRTIQWNVPGGEAGKTVVAEVLGLDSEGQPMGVTTVKKGDKLHLNSRVQAKDFKLTNKKHQIEAFAPVPLLRVKVMDGLNEAVAYCTNVPWLHMYEPSGEVITSGNGDTMHVLTALPLVDSNVLSVTVDCVDLFANMVPPVNPATAFPNPGAPISGTVMIGTNLVEVTDLVVDLPADNLSASAAIGTHSSNTLRMNLKGLGCGGHVVKVNSAQRPGALPTPSTPECLRDDIADRGDASTFEVSISSPLEGTEGNPVPTPVMGEVCHGLEIAGLRLNGMPVDTSGQMTMAPADPTCQGDTITLGFNESLDQTDLAADIANLESPLGQLDPGSNRVVADAIDVQGHRAFDDVIFATGDVAPPGEALTVAIQTELDLEFNEKVSSAAKATLPGLLLSAGEEIENAYAVGITPEAIQKFVDALCTDPVTGAGVVFDNEVTSLILSKPDTQKSIPVPCSCDPTVTIHITDVIIDPTQISCPVTFMTDKIHVVINVPDVRVDATVNGSCKDTFLGVCISKTKVNLTASLTITGTTMDFDITEAQLLGAAGADPNFNIGTGLVQVSGQPDISCIGAELCNVLAEVFTFGAIDLEPEIDISKEIEFKESVKAGEPDPIALDEVKLDEVSFQQFDQKAKGMLDSVSITTGGITAGLNGTNESLVLDPSIDPSPGATLTPAPLPVTPVPNGGDVYLAIADDVFNQILASESIAGKLKTGCQNTSGTKVGDILPDDCSMIMVDLDTPEAEEAVSAGAQALCHGIRGDNCETIFSENVLLTPVMQGVCHATEGDNCATVPAGLTGFLYPSDCETINIELPASIDPNGTLETKSNAVFQGLCHASKADDCETLFNADADLQAIEQGACHGAKGDDCQAIAGVLGTIGLEKGTCEGIKGTTGCLSLPLGQPLNCLSAVALKAALELLLDTVETETCDLTPSFNVTADTQLLFCAQADIAPRLLIQDDTGTGPVETSLRLNDLSVAMIVDRNGNGLEGELTALQPCLAAGTPTTGDCLFFGLCLDLNFVTQMEFGTCTDGLPGLFTSVQEIQVEMAQEGIVCGGSMSGDDSGVIGAGATSSAIDELMDDVDMFTPPSCAKGFDLGDTIPIDAGSLKLISIETDGNTDFQDYLAITGNIVP